MYRTVHRPVRPYVPPMLPAHQWHYLPADRQEAIIDKFLARHGRQMVKDLLQDQLAPDRERLRVSCLQQVWRNFRDNIVSPFRCQL